MISICKKDTTLNFGTRLLNFHFVKKTGRFFFIQNCFDLKLIVILLVFFITSISMLFWDYIFLQCDDRFFAFCLHNYYYYCFRDGMIQAHRKVARVNEKWFFTLFLTRATFPSVWIRACNVWKPYSNCFIIRTVR